MIRGLGTDIVKIERVNEKLAEKVLTGGEEFKNSEHFAGLWAAKEAVLKALGCGISDVSFKDIEISYTSLGAPIVNLNSKAEVRLKEIGAEQVLITISHEREFAVAFAVAE